MVGTNMYAGKVSHTVNMTTKEKEEKKRHAWRLTGLSVTAIRYGGHSRASLAACAQSCRAKSLGLGLSLADKLN
jgi:hypothetical protein